MINKHLLAATLLCASMVFGLVSCSRHSSIENGVSLELAQSRKNLIKDLKYNLFFDIPTSRDSAIVGRVNISFKIDQPSDNLLPIDFKAHSSNIISVKVNGNPATYSFENEHILTNIPKGAGLTTISIEFIAPDQSLNRRDDLLYSLLVPDRARTLFPCFDQPNLKALYTLSLHIPDGWSAVSNTSVSQVEADGRTLSFRESEPLSTYLFSFVAGEFKKESTTRDGRSISMYHRENDPSKLAQIPAIFDEVFDCLTWLEEYTDIPYPFEKYDFIVLPGFQYGGMEHTGATLYNDSRIFLSEGHGVKEQINRYSLIAHETSHLWFGDYVTMDWFNDVWTKEVFANYFATQMVAQKFPDVDRSMSFVDYARASYSEDRTEGTNPIKQDLDNLRNAGLVYGNIIYNKSPIVMEMLVGKIGKEAFREGMQEYLHKFAYGNATWEELIEILDNRHNGDLQRWSEVWVNSEGMPTITSSLSDDGRITLHGKDPSERGRVWEQNVTCLIVTDREFIDTSVFYMMQEAFLPYNEIIDSICCKEHGFIIPNIDAKAYGYFKMDTATMNCIMSLILRNQGCIAKEGGHCNREEMIANTGKNALKEMLSPVEIASTLINLNENYLRDNLSVEVFSEFLLDFMDKTRDQLLFSQAADYLSIVQLRSGVANFEERCWTIVRSSLPEACRRKAFSLLIAGSGMPLSQTQAVDSILNLIRGYFYEPDTFKSFKLNENDLTTLSYELAIRFPSESEQILAKQRSRISNLDRLSRFDFIARAVSPEESQLDSLFNSLMKAENRRIEPWATSALSYLNHPLRAERSRKYIRPALEELQEIQITGDIFFPKSWVSALLTTHPEPEAQSIARQFLSDHPDYPPMLTRKIKMCLPIK